MRNFLHATFNAEEPFLRAARNLREKGIPIFDAYSPYPIHEMEEYLDIRRSRLPIVCFIAGCLGFLFAMGFQLWAFHLDWPIIVGGKPFNAVPAFMPVAFECTVLIGGLVTVVAFLFRDRLFPGKRVRAARNDITDDHFVLSIEHADASLDREEIQAFFLASGATSVEEKEMRV